MGHIDNCRYYKLFSLSRNAKTKILAFWQRNNKIIKGEDLNNDL